MYRISKAIDLLKKEKVTNYLGEPNRLSEKSEIHEVDLIVVSLGEQLHFKGM